MESSFRDSREWREVKGHFRFFAVQLLSITLKSIFLVALLAIFVVVDKVFHLFSISRLSEIILFALEVLFASSILLIVAIYLFFYVRGIYEYYSAVRIEYPKLERHKKPAKTSLLKSLKEDAHNLR